MMYIGILHRYPVVGAEDMISRQLASATLKPMVLAILANGPEYGYRIIQRIQDLSEGDIEWTTGALYPFLHGLENEGVLECTWKTGQNAPRRKYYGLTPAGQKALAVERQQWFRVHAMLSELFGPAPALQMG
jgi:PadR family transcriptional regulator PadR